jgi:hypothetical protein
VTYLGQPLRIGSIVFVPEAGGKTAMANISREGEYILGSYEETDGAITGKHKIMIIALTSPGGSGLPEDVIKPDQAPVSVIPERFSDQNKSKLVAEVKEGENTINFVLTDKTGDVKYN